MQVDRRGWTAGGPILASLFLATVTMRPQLVGVGPLLPLIRDDLGISHKTAGLLVSLPVLCMGMLAPAGVYLARPLGPLRGAALCMAAIAVAGLARAASPSVGVLIAVTLAVGGGIGVAGAVLPLVVRAHFASSSTAATGVYAMGINAGSALAALLALPLADALGGWRASLAALSAGSLLAVLPLLLLQSGRREAVEQREPARSLPVRRWDAWRLALMFALLAVCFYGLTAWLAASAIEVGKTDNPGLLLALLNLTALGGSLSVPLLAGRSAAPARHLTLNAATFAFALIGLTLAPGASLAWAAAAGAANGALFALLLAEPLRLRGDTGAVAALATMMLSLGYAAGAGAPVLLGALRDMTGSFDAVLWAIALSSVTLLVLSIAPGGRVHDASDASTGAG